MSSYGSKVLGRRKPFGKGTNIINSEKRMVWDTGCGRWGNRSVGSLVLVTTIFCVIINPFTTLVALLVVSQLSNLALELLDGLEKGFHGGWIFW